MRYSKSKLAFITANQELFTVIASLKTSKGDAPEVNTMMDMPHVIRILDSVYFFKNLGGTERVTLSSTGNGDYSILTIDVFSRSPDGADWTNRMFTLQCTNDTLYALANR